MAKFEFVIASKFALVDLSLPLLLLDLFVSADLFSSGNYNKDLCFRIYKDLWLKKGGFSLTKTWKEEMEKASYVRCLASSTRKFIYA